jgi:hypothetical protein
MINLIDIVAAKSETITLTNPLKWDNVTDLIENITNFLTQISLIIVPAMVIVSAFIFLTSAGDPKKIATGKAVLLWTVIGTAIVLISGGIISIVKNVIGVEEDTTQIIEYYSENNNPLKETINIV